MAGEAHQKILDAEARLIEEARSTKEIAEKILDGKPTDLGNVRASAAPQGEIPWPVMDAAAFYGLPGAFVKAIEPYSEADPVALLLHTLVAATALIGSGPHALVEYKKHFARLNVIFVGLTAKGRKGTAWSMPRYVLERVDDEWVKNRVKSGLSSAEGLVYQVRDPEGSDPGEADKRLLIIEEEFAGPLKIMERKGNTLGQRLRDAWDLGNLGHLTKIDRLGATGAHICVIGHVTRDELLRYLTATEMGNGFANRFLFALVKRSKLIPSGKGAPASILESYGPRFSRTLNGARTCGLIARDPEAEALWEGVYPRLSEEVPGLTGKILARGEPQVLRLSMVYALLDEAEIESGRPAIRVPHLLAALAAWDYCKTSVFSIFGDAIGDPVADQLSRLLKAGPQTDTDLYEALGKHKGDGGRKDQALELLSRLDRVHPLSRQTGGRPVREWHAGAAGGCGLCAKRP